MANKMLIDASHPEETRVVVLRGNRVEEFDFEAANKKQLRGNIYLAKVTRVEPSLQAAFIEYGGNRHGFLAFSEIHPDYYQIPVADRQALLEDEARSHEDEDEEPRSNGGGNGGNGGHRRSRRHRRGGGPASAEKRTANSDETVSGAPEAEQGSDPDAATDADHQAGDPGEAADVAAATPEPGFDDTDPQGEQVALVAADDSGSGDPVAPQDAEPELGHGAGPEEVVEAEGSDDTDAEEGRDAGVTTLEHGYEAESAPAPHGDTTGRDTNGDSGSEEDGVEQLGGDALEDVPHRPARPRRNYKIQEVIKRRQVLLVQVVKEERGNKGAALTTYLSLAGRYSVLMPNTARGGGISRKITDAEDRKRLKAIAQELEVPDGMGIILRTAGAARGMPEVKRDFEYLMRMWETVRELTLRSSAPMLVYEEGSLIKRSIRDLFNKDVDEVIVAGDEGYREAREFMRLLMPGQTKNVIAYRDPQPIFAKAGAEAQLDAMFSNHVTLRSGGYLVINQTEALVAIDVNSGRSTREHNIEDTALRTNLEAADEVARQLRLRDLAGLIVVDFIDMEEGRNDRAVEKRIKDALKNDRARIQIGRISHFGLLEMSRQRMRTGVLEGSTVMCPHCAGAGMVRSISSIALHVLRMLEDALIKSAASNLTVRTRNEVALYILNQKRTNLLDLETRFGVTITVQADLLMTGTVYHAIEHGSEATPPQMLTYRPDGVRNDAPPPVEEEDEVEVPVEEVEDEGAEDAGERETRPVQGRGGAPAGREPAAQDGENGDGSRRRKRRRRRRGRDNHAPVAGSGEQSPEAGSDEMADGEDEGAGLMAETDAYDTAAAEPVDFTAEEPVQVDLFAPDPDQAEPIAATMSPDEVTGIAAENSEGDAALVETPRRRRTRRSPRSTEATAAAAPAVAEEEAAPVKRPRRSRARVAEPVEAEPVIPSADIDIEADTAKTHPAAPDETPVSVSSVFAEAEPVEADPAATPEPAEDPNRPKRSGWWQRAKATFSSGT